ncbi:MULTISPECIES: hypothetical protein [unclassified Helicobacter]|uniref:hypothetical protein n=1 Tax=unclassified Helicobacter TaxID=2593540 RepID=UPI000CF03E73|nr:MULTISPECIES: hypothetical protein [unclassified Helicobacter]
MSRVIYGLFALFLMLDFSFAAPKKSSSSTKKELGKFTPGSIADGTTGTGKVRRWYFFNEGAVGSSYTFLGKSEYLSVDLGYSLYIRSIESVLGGMNLMIGTEISAPIFLRPMRGSKSNILENRPYLERTQFEGVVGGGVQLPLMLGLEYKGFYVVGFGGYTWLFMKDTYPSDNRGDFPTIKTQYDGVIYGGGLGYKISNIVNLGVRYTGGSLINRGGAQTIFDSAAIADGLDNQSITRKTGRAIYDIPYHRISVFISVIF